MALEENEKQVSELTFKEASVELERVVRQLESGDLELEDALARYTRGVELLRSLRDRLAHAEQKVQVLLDSTSEVEAPDTTTANATSDN
ncbi:exodeoxyribonuclease VII small subunit [Parolsenella massiliensis]|jgi:exodeoxyribonuclease VII small subunit|uniref:exodeoxyribonuclease VII small subunit n=1 Tax=Parolsenella massiliensis TaxID=1871022 RepID=UPI0009349841|nr:exodeoxyribonuclease VII small subunit [Parolsenella massiliensis]